jgi:acetyltransferase-like isoleucine patch superfamily enzyme
MKQVVGQNGVEAGTTAQAAPAPGSAAESRSRRAWRLAQVEVGQLRPRARLAQGLSALLPQFAFNRLRTALWRLAKVPIGEGSLVMGDVVLSGNGDWSSLLSIGNQAYITGPLRINLGGPVQIGNCVNIGHDCLFLTVDHEIGPDWRRAGWSKQGSIVIEDGAWIASRVTILPGVTVGRGAVVAAGALVASSVAPHTLVGGVPARVLRSLSCSSER